MNTRHWTEAEMQFLVEPELDMKRPQ